MSEMSILLIEDDPDDELLTMRELRRQNVANEITVGVTAPRRSIICSRGANIPTAMRATIRP